LLIALFHLQVVVILVNVSGNLNIDINQRYLLVILPVFALTQAVFLHEFFPKLSAKFKLNFSSKMWVPTLIVGTVSLFLTFYHTESFRANIMYRNNKLLEEEKLLNTYLREYPSGSLFFYSRPWQMLSSGFNSFSDRRLANFTEQEFAQWQRKTNNNLYLVRGQDGHGELNRNTRVVGFKTTTLIEDILKKYDHTILFREARNFGYPLTVYHITGILGADPYSTQTTLELPTMAEPGKEYSFVLHKNYDDTVSYVFTLNDQHLAEGYASSKQHSITTPSARLIAGINRIEGHILLPSGRKQEFHKVFFNSDSNATLLERLPIRTIEQEWGSLRLGRSVENNPLRNNDIIYPFGLGSHAQSQLQVTLDKRFREFHVGMGLDDESMCGDGATYEIWADGRKLYASPVLFALQYQHTTVPVQGVQQLTLKTLRGENNMCDHTNWLNGWLR
jgi:hypothetical protein